MSQNLPDLPSLQFLKKQAKQRLRAMPEGKLADAQHALATEYGFSTWAALKSDVLARQLNPFQALEAAVRDMDDSRVRKLLARHPDLREKINDPLPDYGFGQNALYAAVQRTDRAIIDALLQAGANINQRSDWWAGSFGVLDECDLSLLDFLLERGATLDVHAASRLGLLPQLRAMLDADPSLVHARGGDGQTPLHFASTVEIAEFLLTHGADIDALDIDHESTPAQYMLRVEQKRHYPHDRQDVARYLVSRGCRTDILMAAALGDAGLVRMHLDRDPNCIRMQVSDEWFPKQNPKSGGTIYTWTLGGRLTAHLVARQFGHEDIFQLLMDHTPEDMKLALACELGDETAFHHFISQPGVVASLTKVQRQKLPDAAQNNNSRAVQLMLEAGWPPDEPGFMGATALHWAAFNGNAEMIREILRFHPAVEARSREYEGTPLSWAIFASGNSWRRDSADYLGTVQAPLDAGAVTPPYAEDLEPSDAVLEVLP